MRFLLLYVTSLQLPPPTLVLETVTSVAESEPIVAETQVWFQSGHTLYDFNQIDVLSIFMFVYTLLR